MDDVDFQRHYRLSKDVVRWLCDELRGDPGLRRWSRARTVVTVEQQVLVALRFFATGSYQGFVGSDRNLSVHQTMVSSAVRAVAVAIVRRLGPAWVAFAETVEERAATQEAFLQRGDLPGVVWCVDGTFVAIKGPSRFDRTVTKALYWCRKLHYALNVMVVCDAKMRILAVDPSMPGCSHDALVWRQSWVRQQCIAGRLIRHGEYLLVGGRGPSTDPSYAARRKNYDHGGTWQGHISSPGSGYDNGYGALTNGHEDRYEGPQECDVASYRPRWYPLVLRWWVNTKGLC
ncbi:hypothetical protein HPB47_021541 [Ixodes persulcatus]|uniref:Uncharacterized protein n=1 Tax=Ixodes persulcatus TaxID=34615 RepID=A0AC60QDB5_IXOPE|nr:hypothetical protein HPB47_021541 [Ixodes persulcatus]